MSYSVIYGYSDNKGLFTPCGSDDAPDFGYVKEKVDDFDANGKKIGSHEELVFKQVGSHSIQEYISSFDDTTDIKKIFERYQAGDVSVLTKRVGEYLDTLGSPESLLDAQLMFKNGESLFNQLPADIKNKYDNDPLKFVQGAMSGELGEYFDIAKNESKAKDDELAQLRAKVEELEKGGIKYE